jgi:hypothetical protein
MSTGSGFRNHMVDGLDKNLQGPCGNPSMDTLAAIFEAVCQTLGVDIQVRTVKTA